MSQAGRDQNFVPTLLGVSSSDGTTPIPVYADPTTHRLLVDIPGGSGTVTSVSVVTANGFAGTVANATTTPAITLSTTVTGILKGNGTAISAATPGTDYTSLAFKTIAVSGQSDVVADTPEDTLTLAAGTNITITTNAGTDTVTINAASGSGDVVGPASATDNAIARYDGTTGKLIQNSGVTISDLTASEIDIESTAGFLYLKNSGQGAIGLITTGAQNDVELIAGDGTSGGTKDGGRIRNIAGSATADNGSGGNIEWTMGAKNGSGVNGQIKAQVDGSTAAFLNFDAIATTEKTFTFPNASGTIALTTGGVFDIKVGTTTISNGTDTRILYDNSGVLGEYTITGSGTVVVMQSSPAITTATFSGAQTLAENASIALDPVLSADGKYTGTTISGTAGTTLAFGDLIYLAVADSRWELADADSATTAGGVMMGFCVLAAAADGDPTVILLDGNIRADTAFPSLTVGAPVYASTTAGDVQTSQPSGTDDVIQVVGFGLTADSMIVKISPDYITHI